jgi:uncharacterized membrane protein SpoIIM required for sporulation
MNGLDASVARKQRWTEFEKYCAQLEKIRGSVLPANDAVRFASLYRSACADLAMAEAYQLPENMVDYLNRLVGRAHNQLYRSQKFQIRTWGRQVFVDVPRALLNDRCLHLAFVLFFGLMAVSWYLGYQRKGFAIDVIGEDGLRQMEEMYSEPLDEMDAEGRTFMLGFYIKNNAGIGIQCFAMGLLGGVGGLFALISNAVQLGTIFGYMQTTDGAANFNEFVTAHGPFELTTIVLSAAAGMRLGFSIIHTRGYTRIASFTMAAKTALPTAITSVVLFCFAALIEAFVSPSPIPFEVKQAVAGISVLMLLFYFFGLGFAAKYRTTKEAV